MATKKITETGFGSDPAKTTNFLVSQPEPLPEGGNLESVRRVQADKVATLIKQLGKLISMDDINLMELVSNIESTETGLRVTWISGQEQDFKVAAEGGGLSFDGGYQDEEGYLHLTKDGEDIEGFDPIKISGGGGGSTGGSKITFACYTPPSFSVMDTSGTAQIRFKYASVDTDTGMATGAGNLTIYVGGAVKANLTIEQGDNLTVDVFKYLAMGTNAVKLTITDSYGSTATRNFAVTKENFGMEWSLTDTYKNTEENLVFNLTPTGSGSKTIYTYVDGDLFSTDVVTASGRRMTKTITGLTHGAHTIEVYGVMEVSGSALESNHLISAVAQVGTSKDPIVAVKWPKTNLTQYTNVQIPYMIIDPAANPAGVQLLANGSMIANTAVDQSEQIWTYRPTASGTVDLEIRCGATSNKFKATVEGLDADVEEITDGLAIKLDPATISSLTEWNQSGATLSFSEGFDFVNGGLQTDAKGIRCIRITAGDRMTLNYPLFSGDTRRTGKEFKVVYKIENSSNKDAVGVDCMSANIGFSAHANNIYLSGNQTKVKLSVCEDEKVELDVNIQQDTEDRLIQLWEQCSTFAYKQYAPNETFTHNSDVGVTFGCDDADVYVYLFRAYNRSLTDDEIKANYIFDGEDGSEILARLDRNDIYDASGKIDIETAAAKNPNAHFIVIDAERMTHGKKDTVAGSIRHIYVNGGAEHRFTAKMEMVIQGTSSVEHADTAGGNLTFKLKWGIDLETGEHKEAYAMNGEDKSIPITKFNFKKNIASEEHIVNMMSAELYHKFQPTIRQNRVDDPRVRDCMEACMCAVFFHNTSNAPVMVGPDLVQPDETTFFGLGNLCVDKGAEEAYQYDPIVIEVKNNTEPQVRFKSDDLSNFEDNFEFRYIDENKYTETQGIELFQSLCTFICGCDYTQATDIQLESPANVKGQIFNYDSAEYRKAKWKAYAADYMDMPGMYWHHNITLFHLLRDNRAKNMFWSYDPRDSKWHLRFNWDNDTGHCRSNTGYIDIEPGYLDTDRVGTADVFNAADNVLFQMIRECNFKELQAAYVDRESAGAWNIEDHYQYAMTNQEYFCESLWIEDAQHNAIRTMQNLGTTAYLERATGRLRLHLKKSLTFQKVLVDSYYNAVASTSDSASFRGYTPTEWTAIEPNGKLQITPYTNMFINILAGSTPYRERAYEGKPIEIDVSAELNDTEIYIRDAQWIMNLGSMAGMYLGQFEASRLKRVKQLLVGSDAEGYFNTNFKTASFDNCKKLEYVNLGGLVNAKQAFDFTPNIYLNKLYTKGSGVTGITFAKNGRVEDVQLNAVASLHMVGLRIMNIFSLEDYEALTSVVVEDCPAVDSYALANAAVNLARVRLLDIKWTVPTTAYEVLMRLHGIHGIDDDGYDTDHGIITGSVHFTEISEGRFNAISEAIPTVEFTYGNFLDEFAVRFFNDNGTEFLEAKQKVERGGKAVDPVATGMIETPTKEPSIDYTYEYIGWSVSLDYIIQDTNATAIYREHPRVNTVTFEDYDGTVLQVTKVPARGTVAYTGKDLVRDGYIWTGWSEPLTNIISDLTVTATYEYPTLPPNVADVPSFDYVYSDDPADRSAYTFSQLYAIIKTKQTAKYIPIKGQIKMKPLPNEYVKDESIVFNLHSVGHYELADGSGMSNADFYMTGVLNQGRRMNQTNTNVGGWDKSEGRQWLNEQIFPNVFPPHWRSLIAKSKTLASEGNLSANILTSVDYLRIPSYAEVGFGINDVPYKNEISATAKEKAFSQYVDSNSRIKKTFNGEGTAQSWWLRSPWASDAIYFAYVNGNGTAHGNTAALAWFWCVGFSA